MADAAALDEVIAKGGNPGPLAGIPLAVKDNHDAVGFPTTHGAPVLADAPAASADSPFVARLRAAGCVVVGKTNMPEFAWSSNTTNAVFGPTANPFNTVHGPGGSSGGSAAALAAGMVPLATGSDGGGSIRLPSACCGLSGMKPSLGRVPGGGPTPQSWIDLSTSGPMARRMVDVVTALEVAVGPDPTDLRSLPRPEASWLAAVEDAHVPVRVAWAPTLGYGTVDTEVLAICEHAVTVLESLGADISTCARRSSTLSRSTTSSPLWVRASCARCGRSWTIRGGRTSTPHCGPWSTPPNRSPPSSWCGHSIAATR